MTDIKTWTQYSTEVKELSQFLERKKTKQNRGTVACIAKTVAEQVVIVNYSLNV